MSPEQELITAAVQALKADGDLALIVGGRIFDRVPEKPGAKSGIKSPYISIGPTSSTPDDVDCLDADEITLQFDAWSWGNNEAYTAHEVRSINRRIRKVLSDADLPLPNSALVAIRYELGRVFRDPDGITNHGVTQFTAIVETT